MDTLIRALIICLLTSVASLTAGADDHFQLTQLAPDLLMLSTDQGSYSNNSLVFTGPDGLLLVDTHHGDDAEAFRAYIEGLDLGKPSYIINTHRHVEHIGGNHLFGPDPIVVAHDLFAGKLRSGTFLFAEYPPEAFPDITFTDTLEITFNNEVIRLVDIGGSHDDNEILVYFTKHGIAHASSVVNGFNFPSVDGAGDVLQFEAMTRRLMTLLPHDVRIVSGHNGQATGYDFVGRWDQLPAYAEMMRDTVGIVRQELAAGKSQQDEYDFNPYMLMGIGSKLYANEHYEDAVIFLKGSTDVYPESEYGYYTHYVAARGLQKLGRNEEAIAESRESVRLNGDFENAASLLIELTAAAEWPVLKGPYLGQKPPGITSEIFAPGIISTAGSEINSVFTPDGNEFYFTTWTEEAGTQIMFTRQVDGKWTAPEVASFSKGYGEVDMAVSYDGQRMFFGTRRPRPGETEMRKEGFDIWFADRSKTGWSEEQYLGPVVNSGNHQVYPTVTRNGTLYFQAKRAQGYGKADIYRSRLINGVYQTPENLGPVINSEKYEGDVFIADDESYLVVSISGREDSYGSGDLYISFAQEDGSWSPLKNMGNTVNSDKRDFCPMVTPDGSYFFFTSKRLGEADIYWIDAKIIDQLRTAESQ